MTRRPSRLVVGVLLACSSPPAPAATTAATTADGDRAARPPPPRPPPPDRHRTDPARGRPCPSATSPSCPTIPARAQPRADRPRYVLHADVRPAEGIVEGDLRVSFTPDLPTDEIVFRLWPNGPRPAATGARLDTGPVTVDGAPAPASRADDTTLVVDPGRTIAAGTTVDIALNWVLVVPGPANDRIAHDGDAMRLGSFFPILPWEPGVGWAREAAVGDFAEASTAPTADFDLTVTVPPGYTVLASGEPDPQNPNHFVAPRPAGRGHVGRPVHRPGHRRRPRARPGDGHRRPPRRRAGRRQPLPRRGGRRASRRSASATAPTRGPPSPSPSRPGSAAGSSTRPTSCWDRAPRARSPPTRSATCGSTAWWATTRAATRGSTRASPASPRPTTTTSSTVYEAMPIPRAAQGRLGEPMSFWTLRPNAYQDGVYTQGVQALIALGDARAGRLRPAGLRGPERLPHRHPGRPRRRRGRGVPRRGQEAGHLRRRAVARRPAGFSPPSAPGGSARARRPGRRPTSAPGCRSPRGRRRGPPAGGRRRPRRRRCRPPRSPGARSRPP